MRYSDIRRHLKPYRITASRTTTINHAFVAAIATGDPYDCATAIEAVETLGQDPDQDLRCVYCEALADTWDHVRATVKNKGFSGYGHTLGNLVPSCKPCNSKKGNKDWLDYLNSLAVETETDRDRRRKLIEVYLAKYQARVKLEVPANLPEHGELARLRDQVLNLFKQADELADRIRQKQSKPLDH